MTHYDITVGNDIARDVHCDIIMLLWVHIMMLQCIVMLLGPSFSMYYYAQM